MTGSTHEGRIAVVTGAARGIGQATCRRLAERGASIVGVDVLDLGETEAIVTAAGAPWLGLPTDLADPAQIAAVGTQVQERFGRCDILVNNAAIDDPMSFDELDVERWRRVLAINLEAPFHLSKALVPLMRPGGWGRIVNIASGMVLNPRPQYVAYRSAKMGLIGFTRALATELGVDGINVNAVSPGITRTNMALEGLPPGTLEASADLRAIKRVAEPDDVVGAILFLTGEDSQFITGQTIMANGGAAFV